MPKQRIMIDQTTIEATGYKIADKIEQLNNSKKAVSIRSKAFDVEAPDGEKMQVQIVVTKVDDFLPDYIDMVTYYEG